jgi:predicted secreted hydrolase
MKNSLAPLALALLALQPVAAQYRTALPGYRFEFPRDYFNHPDFQTEWWYYTGNVKAEDGHRFGFELTFFRQAVSRDLTQPTTWDLRDIYFAHLALSDLDGQKFYHVERANRAGPGIAGASQESARIWNGNWEIAWDGPNQHLRAVADQFQLHLSLHPQKPPVLQGENGVSQKAEGPGHASYYISLTRIDASGEIDVDGKPYRVSGLAWMDHEFFTHELLPNQAGWDWFSVQLDDNTELMLFHIRRNDGSIDPFSAGTYIDSQGKATHLKAGDFTLQPLGDTWKSADTSATYPIHWNIAVPKLGLEVEEKTSLPAQELAAKTKFVPTYWEGAITLAGHRHGAPLAGVGYLEMTGYDRPVPLAP